MYSYTTKKFYVRLLINIHVHCSVDHFSIIYVNRHPFWLVSIRNGLDAHNMLTSLTGILPFDMNLPLAINHIIFLPHPASVRLVINQPTFGRTFGQLAIIRHLVTIRDGNLTADIWPRSAERTLAWNCTSCHGKATLAEHPHYKKTVCCSSARSVLYRLDTVTVGSIGDRSRRYVFVVDVEAVYL